MTNRLTHRLASRLTGRATTAVLACALCVGVAHADYGARDDVRAYIDSLVKEHDFNRAWLNKLFADAEKQTRVLDIMQRPYEALPFERYRDKLLSEARIARGVTYGRQHADILRAVEKKYQVPAELLLAVVGIETQYGEILGGFPVTDTLITLGFDYPRRAKFFRGELTHLLLLAREDNLDMKSLKGSYAGALGIGQFIPSSYRHYAVDGDGDGSRNLWETHDALASVANYLKRSAWRVGAPVATRLPASLKVADPEAELFNRKAKPWLTRSKAKAAGVSGFTPAEEPFSLYGLMHDGAREYWITYHNFYVITRYNHSYKYALVIHQLAQEIKRRLGA